MDNANPISLLVLVLRRGAERHDCLIGNLWNVRYRVVFFFFFFCPSPPLSSGSVLLRPEGKLESMGNVFQP